MKALKYCRRPDLPARIRIVLAEAPVIEEEDLKVILTYLNKGPVPVDYELLDDALIGLEPERKERIMGRITQPYYEKGLAEGEAKLLTRFLEKRFGMIPAALRQRIFAADVSSIDAWAERILDAPSLESIFESN